MVSRVVPGLVVLALLGGLLPFAAVAQQQAGILDQSYTSPNWGYSVRWPGSEWTIEEETSENGQERLWLSDASRNVIGFFGMTIYGSDASACLNDQMNLLASVPEASDITVVLDDRDEEQIFHHPWRSWALLLVAFTYGDQTTDHVIYFDCRLLVPGEAILFRFLNSAADTFGAEDYDRFYVLDGVMPRSALLPGTLGAFWSPSEASSPWELVTDYHPILMFDRLGTERGVMTIVGVAPRVWAVTVENSSATPLLIDPARFVVSTNPASKGEDVTPVSVAWEDTGAAGLRTLLPGAQAALRLVFPAEVLPDGWAAQLVYRDEMLVEGEVSRAVCLDVCTGGGAGSRPRLRISR